MVCFKILIKNRWVSRVCLDRASKHFNSLSSNSNRHSQLSARILIFREIKVLVMVYSNRLSLKA